MRGLVASVLLLGVSAGCTGKDPTTDGTGGAMSAAGMSGAPSGGSASGAGSLGGASGSAGTAGGASGTAGAVASAGNAGSGGAGGTLGGSAGASGGGGVSGSGDFSLTSPDVAEGSMMAAKYTCAAAGFEGSLSPELTWTAGPPGTKSYAITFIDVFLTEMQPPDELGYHWVIYDIPASTLSLPEEFKDAASIGASQNRAYLGPCPNFGGGTTEHTYEFKLYALETETLTVTPATGIQAVKDAETKLEASHLATATLSAKSNAAPP